MDRKKLSWYLDRLSKMSLKETFWRLDLLVNQPDLSKMRQIPLDVASSEMKKSAPTLGAKPKVSQKIREEVVSKGEAALRHGFEFFGDKITLPGTIFWLKDPANGKQSPRKDFLEMNYRDLGDEISIMRIWFLNRHYHLIDLAKAYAVTEDEKYAEEIVSQLNSFMKECAYPYGLPWATAMEVAMRLLVWCHVYRQLAFKLPNCFTEAFALSFMTVVKQHYEHVKFNRSRFSSANNHALAELTALIAAKKTFPILFAKEKENWEDELLKEAKAQFSAKGVNLEEAYSYQAFSLELLCAAACFSPEFLDKAKGTLNAAAQFMARANGMMMLCGEYGDSDEAMATGLIPRNGAYYENVTKLALALSSDSAQESNEIGEDYQWYALKIALPVQTEDRVHFSKDVGMFWKGATKDGAEVEFFFMTGPLGYGPLAAHGHADALSFTMSINGTPVFIDPGTGNYHQNRKWREYFRSTFAHNTMTAENESQSKSLGPFMWKNKYRVEIESDKMTETGFDLSARHYGYKSRFGLTHRRTLVFESDEGKLTLKDETLGCDGVTAKQHFHLSPLCEAVQKSAKEFLIKGPSFEIEVEFFDVRSVRLIIGDEHIPLGFRSTHLGKREPCGVIVTETNCIGQDALISSFKIRNLK